MNQKLQVDGYPEFERDTETGAILVKESPQLKSARLKAQKENQLRRDVDSLKGQMEALNTQMQTIIELLKGKV